MDEWKNLKRVLSLVKETIDERRIIGSKSLTDVYMWTDADYAVHSDIRNNTGGVIYMRHGVFHKIFGTKVR